jgi:hypothetical protein
MNNNIEVIQCIKYLSDNNWRKSNGDYLGTDPYIGEYHKDGHWIIRVYEKFNYDKTKQKPYNYYYFELYDNYYNNPPFNKPIEIRVDKELTMNNLEYYIHFWIKCNEEQRKEIIKKEFLSNYEKLCDKSNTETYKYVNDFIDKLLDNIKIFRSK